jgi:GTP-binding protein
MTIKITSATFSACITSKNELPKDNLPIVALVGRSNVGKSSMINSITGRKELARTSSMPGKTLTINFYCINDAFYLVDLPGYGYAKASKATKSRIQQMMNEFFGECDNLKGVIQVIDVRHRPSTLDLQMRDWIQEQRFNGFVVLTKNDKLSNQQSLKMRAAIAKDIGGAFMVVYSSKSMTGRDDFLDALEKVVAGYTFKRTGTEPARRGGRRQDNQKRRPANQQRNPRNRQEEGAGTGTDKAPQEGAIQGRPVRDEEQTRRAEPNKRGNRSNSRRNHTKSGGNERRERQDRPERQDRQSRQERQEKPAEAASKAENKE